MSMQSLKQSTGFWRRVGEMRAWEFFVTNALFLFVAGFVFAALKKAVPAVFGESELATLSNKAIKLTQAAAVTGQYRDAPEELQIV